MSALERVTFEVLKNAFANLVDQMSEQLLRTCYSFVIYCRDFSNCLCDAEGETVMQGTRDIAVHVGTLHFTAKAVIARFRGDIHPGDVFMVNDPYAGGTHFCDVRLVRPVFHDGQVIAFTQSNGHWADIGGSQPGSFDIRAKEHFGEGLRITPIRIVRRGEFLRDIAEMIVSNTRAPADAMGDLLAQIGCTAMGEARLLELVRRYGVGTVLAAFRECQDYVERFARAKVAGLPEGTWSTEDFLDQDPAGEEGLIPIRVAMTIRDGAVRYDFAGTHDAVGCFLNATEGSAFSAVVAGTKTFFPEIPLNSGFYRFITADFPPGSVVNAPHPVAVTGFCSGAYEKIMNAVFELWSRVLPDRGMACCFNLEYLIHAQNWDWKAECAETVVVLKIRREDGPDVMTFTEAGGLARNGFNAAGIAVTANYLESDRDYRDTGVPLALIRRKALMAPTLALAMHAIYCTPKSASNNMMVSHADGVAISFECAPDESFQVLPEDGLLVHANHWISPVALAKLKDTGIQNTPDSLYRDIRVRDLLGPQRGRITVDAVKAALFDEFQWPWSVCRPPRKTLANNLSASVAQVVLVPAAGLMEVAMLPALNREFTRYTLAMDATAGRRPA
ncbi:hydantoinase B/oxoprolinase family protein [Leptolyngbya sp. 15MV]|nr:hydantoinase B/oxoprolinase family protein [Leptolyngbya sp. 15MV]